eukprot:13850023-Alexandrium_andersonii.AAC.1
MARATSAGSSRPRVPSSLSGSSSPREPRPSMSLPRAPALSTPRVPQECSGLGPRALLRGPGAARKGLLRAPAF